MIDDFIREVQEAIEYSRNWAVKGWAVTFGPRSIEVSSLKQAQALPRNFVFRDEAVNYWNQVLLAGNDTAEAGEKALAALKVGDLKAAADALYLSQYIEKPFAASAATWGPLYEAMKERIAGQ
jgi:hypothetical protein